VEVERVRRRIVGVGGEGPGGEIGGGSVPGCGLSGRYPDAGGEVSNARKNWVMIAGIRDEGWGM